MTITRTSQFGKVALALWYLLASTNLVFVVLDHIIPATKQVASVDFPCAHHDCGCKTAEQCRLQCCCFPKRDPQQELCHLPARHEATPAATQEPVTIKISYLSVAQCAGHGPQTGLPGAQKLQPHLPVRQYVASVQERPVQLPLPVPLVVASVVLDPPDKIPI